MARPVPTWDTDAFMPIARRQIRERLRDVLPPHEPDRGEFIEDEAQSLAYALAEVAAERLADIRSATREHA